MGAEKLLKRLQTIAESIATGKNPLQFRYTNYRGEIALRHGIMLSLWYGTTDYHRGRQWFVHAFDTDKQRSRDFAVNDMEFSDELSQAAPGPGGEIPRPVPEGGIPPQ